MTTKEKHYAEFFSPGTLFAETSVMPMETEDPKEAVAKWRNITERYGAKPYAFQLYTNLEHDDVDGFKCRPKEVRRSGYYFLGGTIRTAAEVLAGTDEKEDILRSNVRCNEITAVVTNTNSYRSTQPFGKNDVVVHPDTGDVLFKGEDYAQKTNE